MERPAVNRSVSIEIEDALPNDIDELHGSRLGHQYGRSSSHHNPRYALGL